MDFGHPQAAGGGLRPPPMAGSFFFFFFGWFTGETNLAGRISPPGRWGGSRPPPVAGSIFFFCSPEKSLEVGGGWRRPSPEVGGGLFIWLLDLLIGCFDYIFS